LFFTSFREPSRGVLQ